MKRTGPRPPTPTANHRTPRAGRPVRGAPWRLAVTLAAALALGACGGRQDPLIEFSGPTMGTYYSVKIARPPAGTDAAALQSAVVGALDQVIAEISTYDPESELSRLNRNPSTDWIPVSPNLYAALAEGQRIAALSGGAFDITVGPLVNLWGFGPQAKRDAPPTQQEIDAAKARVGWQKLELRDAPPAVRKARGDLYIDLSALGEGCGVERVAALLESRGITDYMVAVAGTIGAKGRNATGKPWAIAIEEPSETERSVHRVIPLTDQVVSTSGDYRNFFEKNGKHYSHEIDPMTGAPVDRKLGSVTVIGDKAMTADGLATALMVLGETRGPALAESQGLAAYFIVRDGETLKGIGSRAFQPYLTQ